MFLRKQDLVGDPSVAWWYRINAPTLGRSYALRWKVIDRVGVAVVIEVDVGGILIAIVGLSGISMTVVGLSVICEGA